MCDKSIVFTVDTCRSAIQDDILLNYFLMKNFFLVLLFSFVLNLGVLAKTEERSKIEAIFKAKCMDCHSDQTNYPWYFNLPIAKDIIQADVQKGKSFFHLQRDLFDYGNDKAIPKHVISRLKHVIEKDSMPIPQYKLLHWDKVITAPEKTQILAWLGKLDGTLMEPLKPAQGLDSKKVELGRALFHDKRLSGDLTISCATCHDLKKGGTDQIQYSKGIRGQVGPINSPTVFNSVFNFKQFWDGRAQTLEAQAHGPVHNPIEMGSNWDQVLERIREDDALVNNFKTVFGIKRSKEITGDMIANSIAEFEKSLITPGAPFDKYLLGDNKALSADEKKGYELFKSYGCASCHNGPALGGSSFQKMGLVNDYFKDRSLGSNGLSKMLITEVDNGRFNVTKIESDRNKFKVPILRNIELTYPYFHDGSVRGLDAAVKYMAYYQSGKKISDQDTQLIVKFLKTLTAPSLPR